MSGFSQRSNTLILGFYLLVLIAIVWFTNVSEVAHAVSLLSLTAILESSVLLIAILIVSAWSLRLLWTDKSTVPFARFFREFLKSWVLAHFLPARIGDYSLSTFLSDSKSIGRISALITLDKIVTVLVNLALLALLSFAWFHVIDATSLLILATVCGVGIASLFWEKTRRIVRRVLGSRARIFEGFSSELFHVLLKEPARVISNAVFTLLRIGLQSLIFWIVLNAVGAPASFPQAVFIALVGQLAVILAFTPNALGIREPLIVATAIQLGMGGAPAAATIVILHSIEWLHVILIVLALGLTSRPRKAIEHSKSGLTPLYVRCGVITKATQPIAPIAEVVEYKNGQAIGVCGIVKRYAFIPTLYLSVDPESQGKGIGKRLVAKLLSEYRGVIFLTVSPQNPAAHHIYVAAGFKKVTNWRKILGFPTQIMVKFNV